MSEQREKKLIVNHTFARREILENHVKSERSKLIIVIVRRELKGQCITIISSLLSATAGSPQATYQECAKLKSLSPKFSDLRTSQTALFTNWSVPQRNISPQSKLNRNCNILNIRTPHPHTIFDLSFAEIFLVSSGGSSKCDSPCILGSYRPGTWIQRMEKMTYFLNNSTSRSVSPPSSGAPAIGQVMATP